MSVNVKIHFDKEFRSDRGINVRYPEGTTSKVGAFIDDDTNVCLFVKIYFQPDGDREFTFYGKRNVTETLSGLISMDESEYAPKICFSPNELALLDVILVWLTDHKDEIYPKPSAE